MTPTSFQPDYTHVLDVLLNRRPKRLPLYEHHIDPPFMAKALNLDIPEPENIGNDHRHYHKTLCGFWKHMTYDAFDYEAAICEILPGHGAIYGGKIGPIQTMDDFVKYPFAEIPALFWKAYTPHLDALRDVMPEGMKAYGGCGYGIFETAEDLVGYESLSVMQYLDPELFAQLFTRIGDLFVTLWSEMIHRYGDVFVFFRMGDDLGFKTSTLLAPEVIRTHIIPQYKRIIDLVHLSGKRFLLHSCGSIFEVMDDLIDAGIDAKHSNEDQIAPFKTWIDRYSARIGLFGGIDMGDLCINTYDEVFRLVLNNATEFRQKAKGYGLGSGNSIAGYVPVEGYMAMIDAVKEIRRSSSSS